ncbi:MAG TPA: crossover junction endodeoxyribonuclease RuvC [Firmicutes bacterium]|nr:crossover junction endodeoxyribonuclease RuvC [Bacillota bacterium]
MIVMGIDPGTASTGYGVIESFGGRLACLDYGCIRTGSNMSSSRRLETIYAAVSRLISSYSPEVIAVEELFFNRNAKTALKVGESRGVVILAAVRHSIRVAEYTPLQIKQAITGYGRASKSQIQRMIKLLLNLESVPSPDDTADALACAICHIHSDSRLANLDRALGADRREGCSGDGRELTSMLKSGENQG